MGKKRRKFEQEVLERLQSIEDDLALLSSPAPLQQFPQPIMYGYTCTCGVWVQFGQVHVCQHWSSPNTCEVISNSSERPDLKIV